MCDVVGASIAYKIVKKDYIALQCKYLIVLTIINRDRVDRNGTDSIAEQIKSGLYKKQSIQTSYGVGAPQGLRSKVAETI